MTRKGCYPYSALGAGRPASLLSQRTTVITPRTAASHSDSRIYVYGVPLLVDQSDTKEPTNIAKRVLTCKKRLVAELEFLLCTEARQVR